MKGSLIKEKSKPCYNKSMETSPGMNDLSAIQKDTRKHLDRSKIIYLKFDEIDFNEKNKDIFDVSDIDNLADNIQEFGFIGTVEVFRKEDGRYELSAGERRVRAAKKCWDERDKRVDRYGNTYTTIQDRIPAIVINNRNEVSDLYVNRRLIKSNVDSRIISQVEYVRMVKYWYNVIKPEEDLETNGKNLGRAIERCAKFLGIAKNTVSRYYAIIKLGEPYIQLVFGDNDNKFPYTALESTKYIQSSDLLREVLYSRLVELVDLVKESNDEDVHLLACQVKLVVSELNRIDLADKQDAYTLPHSAFDKVYKEIKRSVHKKENNKKTNSQKAIESIFDNKQAHKTFNSIRKTLTNVASLEINLEDDKSREIVLADIAAIENEIEIIKEKLNR